MSDTTNCQPASKLQREGRADRWNLKGRISSAKRVYRRTLKEMLLTIEKELESLDDDIFEPSASVDSTAFHVIQEANRLKSLLGVEESRTPL